MDDISSLDSVGFLVRLDSADERTHTPEYVGALSDEAKRRGLLVSVPVSPNTPISRLEFRLNSVTYEDLGKVLTLVTRADHNSNMGLYAEVLKEGDERKPSRVKGGDTVHLLSCQSAKISTIENGVAFYGNRANDVVPIANLEPSPKHGRGHWIVNPKL